MHPAQVGAGMGERSGNARLQLTELHQWTDVARVMHQAESVGSVWSPELDSVCLEGSQVAKEDLGSRKPSEPFILCCNFDLYPEEATC